MKFYRRDINDTNNKLTVCYQAQDIDFQIRASRDGVSLHGELSSLTRRVDVENLCEIVKEAWYQSVVISHSNPETVKPHDLDPKCICEYSQIDESKTVEIAEIIRLEERQTS